MIIQSRHICPAVKQYRPVFINQRDTVILTFITLAVTVKTIKISYPFIFNSLRQKTCLICKFFLYLFFKKMK